MAGDTFDAGTVVAESRLDRDKLKNDILALKRQLTKLERDSRVSITPRLDLADMRADVQQAKSLLRGIDGSKATATVTIKGLKQAVKDAKSLQAVLKALGRVKATPAVELQGYAETRVQIQNLNDELERLSRQRATPTVDVNTNRATKNVNGLGAALGGIPKLALIAVAAVAGFGPASYIVAAALQMVVTAAGGMAVLPAVLGAGIASMVALKLGTKGVGDALKAAAEGDVQALAEALKKLSPNARAFVLEIQKARPAWDAMQLQVQNRLFMDLGAIMGQLAAAYLPMLRTELGELAFELGETGRNTAIWAKQGPQVDSVRLIISNTRAAVNELNPALTSILRILLDVAAVGSQLLPGLASGFADWAATVADSVSAARESGKLLEIMQRGLQTIFSLAGAINSVFGIIGGILRAAGLDGQNLAGQMAAVLQRTEDWVNSVRGQEAIGTFFGNALTLLRALGPLIGIVAVSLGQLVTDIGPALAPVATGLSDMAVAAGPTLGLFSTLAMVVLPALGGVLSFLAPVLGPLVGIMLTASAVSKTWAAATWLATAAAGALNTVVGIARGVIMGWNLVLAIARGNINLLALAQWALNAAWAANPIGVVIVILAALAAALVLAWNHSETFRAVVIGAWEGIKTAAGVVWEFLQGVFAWLVSAAAATGAGIAAAWSWLVGAAQSVGAAISGAWTATWGAITSAAGVVGGVLATAWGGVVSAVQAVGQWFSWLWESILSPVFAAIGYGARVLLAVLVTIVLAPIILAVKALGAIFTWLWENAIQPAWAAISAGIAAAWGVIRPILEGIGNFVAVVLQGAWAGFTAQVTAAWDLITSVISTAWNWLLSNVLQPMIDFVVGQLQASWQGWQIAATAVWTAIQVALGVAWAFIRDVIFQPIIDFIMGPLTAGWTATATGATTAWQVIQDALGAAWAWIVANVFQPIVDFINGPLAAGWNAARDVAAAAWQAISDAIGAVWNWIKTNIFDPLVNFVTVTIPDAFNRAVDGIKGAWDKIQGIVRPPIDFMVGVVYNEGIVPAWNWIAGLVGLGKLETVNFATGGIVPGSGNGDTVPAMLTPGEYVISKPAVAAAGGLGAIDAMHQMLRAGYATGGPVVAPVARFAVGGPVAPPGGLPGAPAAAPDQGGLNSLWSVVTGGLSKMSSMFTNTLWGQAAIGLVRTATDRLWPFMLEKFTSYIASLFVGPAGGGGVMVGGGDARAWIIQHESGGNPTARNPSSTASGLYQMINGTWKAYGGSTPTAAQASVAEQNAVADRYVAARYGSWENAQAFWQTHHYYDAGGYLPPGISTVVNNTGRPEPVLTPEQWRAITAAPQAAAVPGSRPGETVDVNKLNATMTEVRELLERRGTGATVNVNQQGDPVATARAAVLQLRLS